jgi:two-component system sensor histidine kinase HupT/HoxJ
MLLAVCMGVSVMIGVLHSWMARRTWDENWWIALWAALSCLFLGARGVQLTTSDPQAAVMAGKVAIAIGPYLVWALFGFSRNLSGSRMDAPATAFLGGVSLIWSILVLGTPWFVDPEVTTRTDFFGHEHLSVHARWPVSMLSLYIVGAFVWGIRRLRKQSRLEPSDRNVLLAGFGIYALLGIAALLTTAGVIEIPAMAEYGPFVVAVSLSYLLVQRQRRVEAKLAQLLERQSTRLAESQERYRNLVHHAPVGVLVCDEGGAITTINPRMSEMMCKGNAPPALDDGLRATVATVVAQQEVVRLQHRFGALDGERERVWQVTASPFDGSPEERGVLILADDVTERSQLEQQLQQAQKMDSIGQLAAGIAHEINNPMAYVRANLHAMTETRDRLRKRIAPGDEAFGELSELETLIDESMEGVDRTIAIVRDMREFTHTSDDTRSRTDLAPILDACVRVSSVFDTRSIEIHSAIPRDLQVEGAPGPLRQVFLNLLINALQAIDGSGNVWVEAEQDAKGVRVWVHDDGPGVSESVRPRLFDPFFTTKPVGEGTGLGLYISYQIVRSYGGEIRIIDGCHGGASFEVHLPRTDGAA